MSPAIVVPVNGARLSFDHSMTSEPTADGGNLKISVNGGGYNLVPGANYTYNPYTAALVGTNPMAGEDAFTGGDGGTNDPGLFGTSVVDLTGLAVAGDTVRLRWDFGQDGCTGVIGWYVDNVSAYGCQAGGGTPGISIGDVALAETNSGTTAANFSVTLTPADPSGSHSVDFQTFDGTATTADNDYLALNGTITFGPNETSKSITISVVGDTTFEADETFTVVLSNPTGGATIADGQGVGTILNDDKPQAIDTRGELIHDSRETRDLDPISRFWRISQKAHSSYEVVIDAVTGDIGLNGPDLLRLDSDGASVLQSGTSATGGTSKSLRFENTGNTDNNAEFIRVRSAGCTADCDSNDTVRIRAYDTTYRVSRFNNSASQITVLVIANPTDQDVTGTAWFYGSTGQLLTSQPVTLVAHATLVLNTSTLGPLQGQAGTVTFSNDAAFGALTGKAVAVEPATGFTFDTPMVPRAASTKMVPRDN